MQATPPATTPARSTARRPHARRALAAAAAALALALGGCALPRIDIGAAPSPAGGTAGGGTAGTAAGARQGDGGTSVAEFRQDVNDARGSVERYWATAMPDQGRAFRPVARFQAYRAAGEVTCAGEPLGRNNAAYCSAGDFIAYDEPWAAGQFRRIGDAFIFYLVGHEYAHAVQARLAISHRFTIQQELQADCMAGAYISDSVSAGSLELQDGDLDELRRGLLAVGDDSGQQWFAPDAHGTAKERTDAFFDGFRSGLPSCNLRPAR
ncbi:hypothetical protein GCM10010123_34990 [Pilimelia anulata]|uniref:Metalloprotease n=1 Tax=Pilimelia anulata TaxID=53371 RepID=A0A8J3FBK6_9ACTN|nr:neutral zinc metallopeptidase [Pilimelia anulata]GGK02026.1 hypothetical protein GCM10010123_34990 [Pilimelia anulata]